MKAVDQGCRFCLALNMDHPSRQLLYMCRDALSLQMQQGGLHDAITALEFATDLSGIQQLQKELSLACRRVPSSRAQCRCTCHTGWDSICFCVRRAQTPFPVRNQNPYENCKGWVSL